MEFLESVQSKFQKYHKKNNLIEHCKTRAEKYKMTQRELRIQKIDEGRPLDNVFTPGVSRTRRSSQKKAPSPHIDRLTRLKQWKVEKEKKLVEKKLSQKPLFKVGAAKNIGFPALKEKMTSFAPQNHEFKAPKNIKAINIVKVNQRVTRSQKAVASPPLPLPVAIRKKRLTKKDKTNKQTNENKENKQNNFVSNPEPQNQITTRNKLQRQNAVDGTPGRRKSLRKYTSTEESDENEEIINKKTPCKTPVKSQTNSVHVNNITPENLGPYVSPFVTTSRGKGSVKKENLNRSVRGLPSFTESSSLDSSASYFYTILNNEISRLQDFCKTWTEYKESSGDLSEDAKDMIDVAVGQATLLMNKKFKQFEGLIHACQTGVGAEKEVTSEDLQGFWDMIYMQVENLNARFNRLTTLKNNNWEEIEPTTVKPKVIKKRVPPANTKTKSTKPSAASSSIRAAILEARKKKKAPQNSSPEASTSKLSISENRVEESVFNGGFFEVRTPIKTPKPTPKSILKGNKKKSIVIMNKSVLFKDEETESESEAVDLNSTFEKVEKTPPRKGKTPRKCRTQKL